MPDQSRMDKLGRAVLGIDYVALGVILTQYMLMCFNLKLKYLILLSVHIYLITLVVGTSSNSFEALVSHELP